MNVFKLRYSKIIIILYWISGALYLIGNGIFCFSEDLEGLQHLMITCLYISFLITAVLGIIYLAFFVCPHCKKVHINLVWSKNDYSCCKKCGQFIEWN